MSMQDFSRNCCQGFCWSVLLERPVDVKQVLIVVKVFAVLSLLFVPSIVLVLGLSYLATNTTNCIFGFIGITVFMINMVYVFTGARRVRLWRKLDAIAGVSGRS